MLFLGYQILRLPFVLVAGLSPAVWLSIGIVLGFWLIYWYWQHRRRQQWRDLESVKVEYDRLQALLKEQHRESYREQVDSIVKGLLSARDRAEKIEILFREKVAGPQVITREDEQVQKSLSNLREYRERYEKQKREASSLFQNLRIKLLDSTTDQCELDKIMSQVEGIRYVAETIDGDQLPPPPRHQEIERH